MRRQRRRLPLRRGPVPALAHARAPRRHARASVCATNPQQAVRPHTPRPLRDGTRACRRGRRHARGAETLRHPRHCCHCRRHHRWSCHCRCRCRYYCCRYCCCRRWHCSRAGHHAGRAGLHHPCPSCRALPRLAWRGGQASLSAPLPACAQKVAPQWPRRRHQRRHQLTRRLPTATAAVASPPPPCRGRGRGPARGPARSRAMRPCCPHARVLVPAHGPALACTHRPRRRRQRQDPRRHQGPLRSPKTARPHPTPRPRPSRGAQRRAGRRQTTGHGPPQRCSQACRMQ